MYMQFPSHTSNSLCNSFFKLIFLILSYLKSLYTHSILFRVIERTLDLYSVTKSACNTPSSKGMKKKTSHSLCVCSTQFFFSSFFFFFLILISLLSLLFIKQAPWHKHLSLLKFFSNLPQFLLAFYLLIIIKGSPFSFDNK